MNRWITTSLIVLLGIALATSSRLAQKREASLDKNRERSAVLFWHFWGGADRDVVEDVVRQFNQSQDKYFVRAIAMPGNNLQAKLFLAIAGGDPPDLVNQDDPIVGDWAWRGAIRSIDSVVGPEEARSIREFLFPSAQKLGSCNGELFGVCNGLDIRALYFNRTALVEHGLSEPHSISDLDQIARTICPPGTKDPSTFGYLPDSRRLWAWARVFGGSFFDEGVVTLEHPGIVAAAQWMARYAQWYGSDTINRFRQGDQSLPGKTFPLLPVTDDELTGRYVVLMDGQWRVRDINAFLERRQQMGIKAPEFGVCPLPRPENGKVDAGWVNGNLFVIPKGARNATGAVEFIRFWIGMDDPLRAARTCVDGGWIPVSAKVVDTPFFQQFLEQQPMFGEFVRLAASENQFPIPVIPGAPRFKRVVESMGADAMSLPDQSMEDLANERSKSLQSWLDQQTGGQRK